MSQDPPSAPLATLQDLVPRCRSFGERPAVLTVAKEGMAGLSYAQLAEEVSRLATGLLDAGLTRGEAVALIAPNSAEWILAALAVVAAGGTLVPLDLRLPRDLLAHEIKDSGCRRAFASRGTLADLRAAAPEDAPLEVFLLDGDEDEEESGARSWRSLLADEAGSLPALDPGDTAVLFYTSGTTGLPKGVPLSHANLLANLMGLRGQGLTHPGMRVLLPLPLHHVYPFMVGLLVPLDGGAAIVLPAGITGPEIVRALKLGEAEALIGVPGLYEALVTAVERRAAARGRVAAALFGWLLGISFWLRRRFGWHAGRLLLWPLHRALGPQLRIVSSGGAALDADTVRTLEGLGWQVLTGYGLTETAPIVTFTAPGAGRAGTAGRVLPGVELRLAPADRLPDAEASGGETTGGEIQVRGPNVFAGYRNRPEADARAFTADGWFRTGDLGRLDGDGYLTVVARLDEMIVLPGGKNVDPEEVEAVYAKSPYLREVAVLAREGALAALLVPDVAAIQRAGGGDAAEVVRAELGRLSQELPGPRRVSGYRVSYDALPRTSLGKLKRHLLPELFERAAKAPDGEEETALSESDRDLLASDLPQGVMAALRRLAPDRPVTLDSDLQADLGIDSLAWVSLTLDLEEERGIYMDEAAIARLTSVRSLIEAVLEAEAGAFERDAEGPIPPERLRWLEPVGPFVYLLGLAFYCLDWLILRLFFRLRVAGRGRLPASGPFVLAPNHASFLDVFALAAALPRSLALQAYWAGTVEFLFNSRPRRLFSRVAHVFPVDPACSPVSSFLMGVEVLKRGRVLVWFPEGGRSADGRLKRFMPGIGRLIQQPDWPVVPVHISGAFEAWPRGRSWPRLRPLSVTFGGPLARAELLDLGEGANEESRVADGLRRGLAALMAKGERPGGDPAGGG